jgi:hypothetical protein
LDNNINSSVDRITKDEFVLPNFISSEGEAGAVVTLNPDLGTTEPGGQPRAQI